MTVHSPQSTVVPLSRGTSDESCEELGGSRGAAERLCRMVDPPASGLRPSAVPLERGTLQGLLSLSLLGEMSRYETEGALERLLPVSVPLSRGTSDESYEELGGSAMRCRLRRDLVPRVVSPCIVADAPLPSPLKGGQVLLHPVLL